MLGSSSKFFHQTPGALEEKRFEVEMLLILKGYTDKEIDPYLEAYDYFCTDIDGFDGATVVKDLCDIPNLDLDALLHDYRYLVQHAGHFPVSKWNADLEYLRGMEKKGKGLRIGRFVGLTIVSVILIPYKWITYFIHGHF